MTRAAKLEGGLSHALRMQTAEVEDLFVQRHGWTWDRWARIRREYHERIRSHAAAIRILRAAEESR